MAALREVPLPPTKKDLKWFVGLANYYRWFVPKFLSQAGPLPDLLAGKGTQPIKWTREAREAFEDIQTALCNNAVLYVPLPNRRFWLYMDGCNTGLGAVLTQETPAGEQPIFFLSHKFTKAECNYAIIEKEALAIRWAIKHFKL